MLSDIEIAQNSKMKPIEEIATSIGITKENLEPYGHYKAKLSQKLIDNTSGNAPGKLILVTAVNPTPAGEGKTTTTIGLGQAMNRIGKQTVIALREPSLGPVFGIKGGAAGGGYSQVVPMEDINLHFTGDMHAITSANNLLCTATDNHIQQGNVLDIDPRTITFKRVLDMNDRALRNVIVGLGGKVNGVPREDHFQITVASEVMAILCLATTLSDLKERLGNIMIGYSRDGKAITARDIGVSGAMAALLKDAINPNLVQTLENTPAMIHGGPFANIAHGCNSVRATKLAMSLSDYCVTEAGFGSDLGAEKFFDIKCRLAGLSPSAVVIVATIRALKYNAYIDKNNLKEENVEAVKKGLANLKVHVENLSKFGIPVVVALNHFYADTDAEIAVVEDYCKSISVPFSVSKAFEKGGEGAVDLARKVCEAVEMPSEFKLLYPTDALIEDKIATVAKEIYRADGVDILPSAKKSIEQIRALGADKLPICIAKTQYSLSDNPALLGHPKDFRITVKEVRACFGAGFVVVLTGDVMTMPGLPKVPAANSIDIDEVGNISGLF